MGATIMYNGQKYSTDLDGLWVNELIDLERVTGWTVDEVVAKRKAGSALALKAEAYIAVKREVPDLRFEEFDFQTDSIQTDETDGGELADPTPTVDDEEPSPSS